MNSKITQEVRDAMKAVKERRLIMAYGTQTFAEKAARRETATWLLAPLIAKIEDPEDYDAFVTATKNAMWVADLLISQLTKEPSR